MPEKISLTIPLHEPWDNYPPEAWLRNSLAVVACDGNGHGVVLFTAGPHLRLEIEEIGCVTLEDLGLDAAPKGISVWEGRVTYFDASHPLGPDEGCDPEVKGTFRAPTDLEWAMIVTGMCPWNDAVWRKP